MEAVAIIARIRAGNPDAFEQVIDRYQVPVTRYLYRLTGDYETATEFNETMDDDLYKMDPEKSWEGISDIYRSNEKIYEYWIGKDDYIIRKRVITERSLGANKLPVDDLSHESTRQTITCYLNFNELIEIIAPLDNAGELLDEWFVVTQEE